MPTRRRFLLATGQASVGVWAITSNVPSVLAETLASLDPDAQSLRTLTRVARLIYPHDGLPDSVYAGIVDELWRDPQSTSILRTGVASLGSFLELDEVRQIASLKRIESAPFFGAVKTPLMWALYNEPELWARIGYAGPSFSSGGYIRRGFDDIDWLPTS
jgi:hypothetical protein